MEWARIDNFPAGDVQGQSPRPADPSSRRASDSGEEARAARAESHLLRTHLDPLICGERPRYQGAKTSEAGARKPGSWGWAVSSCCSLKSTRGASGRWAITV